MKPIRGTVLILAAVLAACVLCCNSCIAIQTGRSYAGFPEGGDTNVAAVAGKRTVFGIELQGETGAIGLGFWWRRLVPTIETPPDDPIVIPPVIYPLSDK